MSTIHTLLQGIGDRTLADQLTQLDGQYTRVRGAFAYVTERGVRLISRALNDAIGSTQSSNWLTSFDHGITTVGGIEALQTLDESAVRVASAEQVLTDDHLRPTAAFHPKLLWLTVDERHSIWIGSANLTDAGLSTNREVSLAVSNINTDDDLIIQLDKWWTDQWTAAAPVTAQLLERYANLRSRTDTQPLTSVRELDEPAPSDLHEATLLWTQVGYTQGGSRNQMDVPARCGPFFFGEPIAFEEGLERSITLVHEGERHTNRKARYHGNAMTRVYLPTETHGERLKDIDNRHEWFALFKRTEKGVFELELLPPDQDSPVLSELRKQSRELRQTDTAGDRPLGWL